MRMTPPHLQPVLSRVKRFVERQPEGATLTHLTHKVAAYSGLNRKDKETLIEIIRESGMLCVSMMEGLQPCTTRNMVTTLWRPL